MAKRNKIDEVSDTDELQALFDSIAADHDVTAHEPLRSAPVAAVAAPVTDDNDDSDDSDELQALFDSVASEFEASNAAPVGEVAGETVETADAAASPEAVFNRLGQMTRKVHNTLLELGFDNALQEVAEAIPDARQRLTYIAQMTEQAASRVLNATDIAKPIQGDLENNAAALQAKWDRLYSNELSVEEFKALASETRNFLGHVREGSRTTSAQLLEIMMAQDFQDLTGQVIKKVVDMAQTLESQLLEVLIEVAPAGVRGDRHAGLMNGPVVNSEGRDDVVTSQGQVDDLLESLGF